ncbi:hypothetical protein [Natronoglycomyces albus]|uniref:Uncharacterized protein n=1 Tax=Natronoglycomyces albus TaxID=2811108 RepID=A0A895XS58_9ACTN|nr:hypothetical protein [Natronoglycomyces albus]QSB06522.1 hypothetical protein JQS30_06355 [Natronoglycomyces albus]
MSTKDSDRIESSGATEATAKLSELRALDHRHGAGVAFPEVMTYLRAELRHLEKSEPRTAMSLLDLAAYEAVDLRADATAQALYEQTLMIAIRSGSRSQGAHVVASLAYLAMQSGQSSAALPLIGAAIQGSPSATHSEIAG